MRKDESGKRHRAGNSGSIYVPLAGNDTVPKRHNVPVLMLRGRHNVLCREPSSFVERYDRKRAHPRPSCRGSRWPSCWQDGALCSAGWNIYTSSWRYRSPPVLSVSRPLNATHTAALCYATKQLQKPEAYPRRYKGIHIPKIAKIGLNSWCRICCKFSKCQNSVESVQRCSLLHGYACYVA